MKLKTLDMDWALNAFLCPLKFVLPGLLPGTFGLIIAPGATGKSMLALDIAVSVAIGREIAGGLFAEAPPAKVVYLAGEETDRLLAERVRSLVSPSERKLPELHSNLAIVPMAGEACALLHEGRTTAIYDDLEQLCSGARLIIVDPVRRMHDGDENNSADMTGFVVAMEQLAKATGAAVLGLHHANRASTADASSQNAARGSTALVDGARWQLNLSRMDERTAEGFSIPESERALYVALDYAKVNYLPPRSRCWLKRQERGGLRVVSLVPSKPKGKSPFGGARSL